MSDTKCDTCGYTWKEILLMGANRVSRHPHTFNGSK